MDFMYLDSVPEITNKFNIDLQGGEKNKIIWSIAMKDKSYAFLAAMDAQNYLDEMAAEHCGTRKFDLMQHFDADNLDTFKDAFLTAMDEYRTEYDKVGCKVLKFDTFDEVYIHYMNSSAY